MTVTGQIMNFKFMKNLFIHIFDIIQSEILDYL